MVFPAILAFAGAMDMLTMTIPNRITLGLAGAFFIAAPLAGLPLDIFLQHVAAGVIVLAASIALFAIGGFGGGDAKLLAAAALWVGLQHLVPFLVGTTVFGGVLALAVLSYRRYPLLSLHLPTWAKNLHQPGTGIPYGIAIAAAAIHIYPLTPWFPAFAAAAL